MGAIWGLFRQGDLVTSLNVQPHTRSRLASLFKIANFGDPGGGSSVPSSKAAHRNSQIESRSIP